MRRDCTPSAPGETAALASTGLDDEPGGDPAAQQRRGLRRSLAVAELLAQQCAELAERPAVARRIEHARLGLAQRAEVTGQVLAPPQPFRRRSAERHLGPCAGRA